MSNRQKKSDIAELVGPLLKRLKQAKERVPENSERKKIIDQISPEVEKTKHILDNREKLDWELAGHFGKIERQIDSWNDHNEPCEKGPDLPQEKANITEVGESSNTSDEKEIEVSKVQKLMDSIESSHYRWIKCLKVLGMFPVNTELKKRLVIYWWIVLFSGDVESYERVISDLLNINVLIPVHRSEHNEVIDRFTIEPIFHKLLVSNKKRNGQLSSEKREEGTWHLYREFQLVPDFDMLLNLDQRYLNSKDIMDISTKHEHLVVVQLGSWRYTEIESQEIGFAERKSKDHIEVDQTDFLKKLGKYVKYLSLRGISGIEEVNESVGKLKDLMILDLRACHNLEKLPQKPRSTFIQKFIRWSSLQDNVWFNNMKILDMSECYLLDHMPKWICELSNLVVLKGFVVGSLGNKSQSCRLGDLSKLPNLRKLSIRIATDILGPEVFRGFNSLVRLLVLTITWGQNKEIPTYSLPKNIEKLDMRCYPEAEASKLQNSKELKELKKLYIRGGNFIKIPCHDKWKVEILRLRFLKQLAYPTNWNDVISSFKNLRYVEYVGCPRPENFPNDGNSWRTSATENLSRNGGSGGTDVDEALLEREITSF